ncbi:hypothetical protein [Streptomyces sp. NPDC050982]|uniref:hypothetical protein n=1 Tax=Streptomyces sp. NPDC050982 TaxID=3154746 RepID=UPI0033D03EFA
MPACILGEVDDLPGSEVIRDRITHLDRPSCVSAHVALLVGDCGGISYVCTACGHSWS